jgi:hypothetical protein
MKISAGATLAPCISGLIKLPKDRSIWGLAAGNLQGIGRTGGF